MPSEIDMKHHQPVGAAMSRSAATGKKIIVKYGGDWCSWSRRMDSVLKSREVSRLLDDHFIYLERYVGPDGTWIPCVIERPPMRSVPYLSLVSADGKILRNQSTESFEFLWFYRKAAIVLLFKQWAKV